MSNNNSVNCTGTNADNPACECHMPKSYYREKLAPNFSKIENEKLRSALLDLAAEASPICINSLPCSKSKAHENASCLVDTYMCLANTRFITKDTYFIEYPEHHRTIIITHTSPVTNGPVELSPSQFKNRCRLLIDEYINYEKGKIPDLKIKPEEVFKLPSKPITKASTHYTSTAVSKPSKSKISTGAIIGIIFAVLVVIAVTGIGIYYFMKKRKEKHKQQLY